jgi:hypothetical protein
MARPTHIHVRLTNPELEKARTLARAREVTIAEVFRTLLYDAKLPNQSNE